MDRITRDKLFTLLRVSSRFESRLRKRTSQGKYKFIFRNYFRIFLVAPFLGAFAIAVVTEVFAVYDFVRDVGFILLILFYLGALSYPLLFAWLNRRNLVEVINNPLSPIIQNANVTTIVDARLMARLLKHKVEDLELLLLEIRGEKEFFGRRLSLVVGAIDKIGLGPGLLAVAVTFYSVESCQIGWIVALAYTIPILYLFGFAAHFYLMQLDRIVKVVELSVARKKSLTTA